MISLVSSDVARVPRFRQLKNTTLNKQEGSLGTPDFAMEWSNLIFSTLALLLVGLAEGLSCFLSSGMEVRIHSILCPLEIRRLP